MANKAFYRHRWFWVFILIVIGIAGTYIVNNNQSTQNTENTKIAKISKKKSKPKKKINKNNTQMIPPKEKRTVGERTAQTFGQVINKRPSISKI